MPRQTAQSGLLAKLGDRGRKAHEQHKTDETTFSGGAQLPEGIEQGIAQLVECKFDEFKTGDNKGEYYFYAAGVVVAPDEVNGIPITGLRTSIMEPLCDTPNRSRPNINSHLAWVYNEFRKLGVDTTQIEFDDLEAVADALKSQAPYFRFRTWKGQPTEQFPNPRVNEDWRGVVDYTPEESDGVVDNTPSTPQQSAPASKPADKQDVPYGDELDMLVDRAAQEDSEAQDELEKRAVAVGKTSQEVGGADTWEEVAGWIREGNSSNQESASELPEPTVSDDWLALGAAADDEENPDSEAVAQLEAKADELGIDHAALATYTEVAQQIVDSVGGSAAESNGQPVVGQVYKAKPTPKAKKLKECEVTAVYEGTETANVRWLDTGNVQRAFPWSQLQMG